MQRPVVGLALLQRPWPVGSACSLAAAALALFSSWSCSCIVSCCFVTVCIARSCCCWIVAKRRASRLACMAARCTCCSSGCTWQGWERARASGCGTPLVQGLLQGKVQAKSSQLTCKINKRPTAACSSVASSGSARRIRASSVVFVRPWKRCWAVSMQAVQACRYAEEQRLLRSTPAMVVV